MRWLTIPCGKTFQHFIEKGSEGRKPAESCAEKAGKWWQPLTYKTLFFFKDASCLKHASNLHATSEMDFEIEAMKPWNNPRQC